MSSKKQKKLSLISIIFSAAFLVGLFLALNILSENYIVGLRIGKYTFTSATTSVVSGAILFTLVICFCRNRINSLTIFGANLQIDLSDIKLDIKLFKETIYPILLFDLRKVEHDGRIEGNFSPTDLNEFINSADKLYKNFYHEDVKLQRYLTCAKAKMILTLLRRLEWQMNGMYGETKITFNKALNPDNAEIGNIIRSAIEQNLNCGLTNDDKLFNYEIMKLDFETFKKELADAGLDYSSDTVIVKLIQNIKRYYEENELYFTSFQSTNQVQSEND